MNAIEFVEDLLFVTIVRLLIQLMGFGIRSTISISVVFLCIQTQNST